MEYKNKTWLEQKYLVEKLSTTEIGSLCDVKACTVLYWLKKHKIKSRTKSEALSGENNPMFQRIVSEETRKKLSFAGTGKKHTEKTKRYLSEVNTGKPKSEEHKKKLSNIAFKRFKVKENHPRFGQENKWGHHSSETIEQMKLRVVGSNNPMYGMTGSLNPNWKGGITPLTKEIRKCIKYKEWRFNIFKRDNFECIQCSSEKYICADHIKPFALILHENKITSLNEADNCTELWNLNNGRTLCQKCHEKTETFMKNIKTLKELYYRNS